MEKKILLNQAENIESKAKFSYPRSILNSIIKLQKDEEIQHKLEKVRNNFNLGKYINKEVNKGSKINLLGRQNSYLEFLKYTQKNDKINLKATNNMS